MKSTLALALFCLVGVTACSPSSPASPGAGTCACGRKASECACETCKGGDAGHCTCGKDAGAHKGHSHGGGHSCGGH
jgi:hypothetical protein